MNFFEQQAAARKQSRWLIVLFVLAVAAIVVAIDAVVLVGLGLVSFEADTASLSLGDVLRRNLWAIGVVTVVTLLFILFASLFKITRLRSGGGRVAQQMGGMRVDSDTRDPLKRRLVNVVEEIALASGVPVPEIYVLDRESGINAFAAGYSPSDAAVAVTRGTLEKLNRAELQGVIAHEFSHILNGDMRINIRLMGTLFGILVLAVIGRRIIIHSRFMGRSSRSKEGGAVILAAVGLMVVGYIGLFFGRWIKAALSRQREYLADASAVQFTRDPDGIGGALKKIAVYSEASYLEADSEEISHMLFGDGRKALFFATHPPIEKRIGRVYPDFQPEELTRLALKLHREKEKAKEKAEKERAAKERSAGKSAGPGFFDAGSIVDGIGTPDWERMLTAAAFAAAIPAVMDRAVRSADWAPEVLFYTLIDGDEKIRQKQLLLVAEQMGADSETRLRTLLAEAGPPRPEQRLPLMELAFPTLKQRSGERIDDTLRTIKKLVEADGETDVFEYLLARSVADHIWAARNPHRVQLAGNKRLKSLMPQAKTVLAILAARGVPDSDAAGRAYRAGLQLLQGEDEAIPGVSDWTSALDDALPALDRLAPGDKETLVRAMSAIVMHDGRMVPAELEFLRVVCDLIHVPLPLLTDARHIERR